MAQRICEWMREVSKLSRIWAKSAIEIFISCWPIQIHQVSSFQSVDHQVVVRLFKILSLPSIFLWTFLSNVNSSSQSPKKLANLEAMERVNCLARVSQFAASDPDLFDLAQYLGTETDLAAKKSTIRMNPKHFFCKKCKNSLIFPLAARDSKSVTCQHCHSRQKVHEMVRNPSEKVQHWHFFQEVRNGDLVTLPDWCSDGQLESMKCERAIFINR